MHSDFPHTPFEKEKGTNPLFDSTESSESAQPLPPADVCAQHYSIRRTTTTVQRCLRRMDCAVRRGGVKPVAGKRRTFICRLFLSYSQPWWL